MRESIEVVVGPLSVYFAEQATDVVCAKFGIGSNVLGGSEIERASEHGQPPKQHLLGWRKQFVRPLNRGVQRAMSLDAPAATSTKEAEAVVEALDHIGG